MLHAAITFATPSRAAHLMIVNVGKSGIDLIERRGGRAISDGVDDRHVRVRHPLRINIRLAREAFLKLEQHVLQRRAEFRCIRILRDKPKVFVGGGEQIESVIAAALDKIAVLFDDEITLILSAKNYTF